MITPSFYDPRKHGAQCDRCPLKDAIVVPPEVNEGAEILVVAEAPGGTEELLGYPLAGASGAENDRAMRAGGMGRRQASYTNAMLCRPPGGVNLRAYLAQVRRRNRIRVKNGKEPLLLPTEACYPRLLKELHRAPALLLLGAYARAAIFRGEGNDKKLMASRGFPEKATIPAFGDYEEKTIPCLSTVHPAFVLRSRRWTSIYRSDIAKAIRMVRGKLRKHEPEMLFFPTPEQLYNFLFALDGVPSYDVETNMGGNSVLEKQLRCVGIGNSHRVTCIGFRSVEDPSKQFYNVEDRRKVERILLDWFADQSGFVGGQNEQFDRTVMKYNVPGFVMGRKVIDLALLHHLAWSELRHDLNFQIAQYMDVEQHKAVDHDNWNSDRELHLYCMLDVPRTSLLIEELRTDPRVKEQKKALVADHFLSRLCRKMHELGMAMDTVERDRHAEGLLKDAENKKTELQGVAQRILGDVGTEKQRKLTSEFNPNSEPQLREFLFGALGIDPVPEKSGGLTDMGEPSVGKEQLFYLIDRGGLPPDLEDFLLGVIDYRGYIKLGSTYCRTEPCWDGRVRATWNPHVVVTGRLSCSKPNLMNLPRWLRTMYVAQPGHVLVHWDKAQLEARILAWLAGEEILIDAFLRGDDIHRVNACAVLGIGSPEEVGAEERQFTKQFVYAVQYLAGKQKAWRMVRSFVDGKGERPYRDLPFSRFDVIFNRFWDSRQATEKYHERNRELQAEQGYLEDAIHGRRRYFLDGGGDENIKQELANYNIQSTAAADMNDGAKRLAEEFPWGFDGPNTGICHQEHDSLTIECREENAFRVAMLGQEVLFSKLGDMPLPVDIGIGKNACDYVEYKRVGNELLQAT